MAESQMQNYEEFRQKEDVTYEEIKTTTEKTEINHLVVKPRNQWLKHFLLILLISILSAGIASTITYLTVCAQLKQLTLDVVNMKKQIKESTDQAQLKQFTLDIIDIKKQIKDSTDQGGFTAFGERHSYKQSSHILKFPNIKLSFGLADLSTFTTSGIFTCEKSGLYLVSVTVMACSEKSDAMYNIYKNNISFAQYYVNNNDCNSGSGTIFLRLNGNDTVYVKTHTIINYLYYKWSSLSILKVS